MTMVDPSRAEASPARPAKKSSAAFRTISEVAAVLEVPQHVLRFWETKFPRVQPLKRGGGRRYYRPEDVELLRRIRDLLYGDGYTIKGVQKLLREGRGKLPSDPPELVDRALEDPPFPAWSSVAPAAAPGGRLDEERRVALKTLLEELQSLRDLLRQT